MLCVIIIIIIKSIYIAQSRWKAANALYEQLHVEQKCLQFVPERCQCNVWCSQCSRKTVPYICVLQLYAHLLCVLYMKWRQFVLSSVCL